MLALPLLAGCAFVQFEPAPYAPRELTVVYSVQEDLTFIAWQLDETADADAVTFELADEDGAMHGIDLATAPFAASPYACRRALCFQYQLPGRLVPPADVPLIRVTHPRFGEFASARGSLVEVSETFFIDPIAVEQNTRADPRRFDWFAEEGIPLLRSYRWRLVAGECGVEASQPELAAMEGLVQLPEDWTTPACFEASPLRADAPGVIVRAPLNPSAETRLVQRQRYDAPHVVHATLYGVLFDLAIADATRCAAVRTAIFTRIASAIGAQDPSAVALGEFEPDDAPGCAAHRPTGYPIARMLATAQDVALAMGGAKTILWIAVSNRAEPSEAFDEAWGELLSGSEAIESPAYDWLIAPGERAPRDGSADWVTPYRSVEDVTLLEDIDTVATLAAPFRTLDHDLETRVALDFAEAPRPEYGRICQAIPQLATLSVGGALVSGDTFAWPSRDAPLYTVDLGEQIGVANESFVPRSSEVLVEVCTRFCDGPFRAVDGTDHESWLDAVDCAGHP